MKNPLLFITCVVIWGSTWLAIKFQLGIVDPMVSCFYRFFLASAILFLYCVLARLNLRYSARDHFFFFLLGCLLFGINYWLVYIAETELPSGLAAITFSIIIFFNSVFGRLFLKSPVRLHIVLGGLFGLAGLALVFKQELFSCTLSNLTLLAFLFCLISTVMASLGNITSVYIQKMRGVSIFQSNAFAMMYGSLFMLVLSLVLRKPLIIDYTFTYIGSLLYLSIFGSIITFGCFLTLARNVGADKAAFVTLIYPVIAMMLTTAFEEYRWTPYAIIGMVLIFSGNFLALKRKSRTLPSKT